MHGARTAASPRLLVWLTLFVAVLGVVMVYSSSAVYAGRAFGDPAHFFLRQLSFLGLGLVGLYAAARLPTQTWRRLAVPLLLVALVACALVLIPGIGKLVGGARRWISFGPLGFQPSELAKLGLVLWLAAVLGRRAETGRDSPPLLAIALVAQLPIGLVMLEPDFGTAVVLELLLVAALFAAGLPLRYLAALGLAAVPIVYALVLSSPYRTRRLLAWLAPWDFRQDLGYQVTEGLISMGSGGLLGVGLGEGRQKLFFLPEAHTDFVVAILGEELGLVGVLALLAAYGALLVIGMRTALRQPPGFSRFLALGLTLLIALPAATNFAVVLGLVPPKGLPLPLFSYGGTNLIVALVSVGGLIGLAAAPRATAVGPEGAS